MKNVVITGSTGGIGRAIVKELESRDYRVIGLESRMEDLPELEREISGILENESVDVLIVCAGFGLFQPHEDIPVSKIRLMVDVNLTAPMVLAKLCLPSLKVRKGHIVVVSSIEATRNAKFSALYTATKSGLRRFALSLFEEVRRAGVKVSSINPDITATSFFDELPFGPGEKEDSYLDPDEVARAVMGILEADGAVTDLTIRPVYPGIGRKKSGNK